MGEVPCSLQNWSGCRPGPSKGLRASHEPVHSAGPSAAVAAIPDRRSQCPNKRGPNWPSRLREQKPSGSVARSQQKKIETRIESLLEKKTTPIFGSDHQSIDEFPVIDFGNELNKQTPLNGRPAKICSYMAILGENLGLADRRVRRIPQAFAQVLAFKRQIRFLFLQARLRSFTTFSQLPHFQRRSLIAGPDKI